MVLRRIGVWSTAKVVGAVYVVFGLIVGLIFAVASTIGGIAAAAGEDASSGIAAAFFGVGAIIFLPLVYGCFGAIFGALSAALYNLFAGMVGGIELGLEPVATVK